MSASLLQLDERLDGLTQDDLLDSSEVWACHLVEFSGNTNAQITMAIRDSVNSTIHDQPFNAAKVDAWTNSIIEGVLGRLVALSKPFKFVVTVMLSQKAGAGMHCAAAARWNPATDGRTSVVWENATVQALITVCWVAI